MPSKQNPHGVLPAVITPFDAQERIDYRAWKKIVDHQIAAGVHGLFFAGGQGEFFSLTSSERREILRECVSMVAGRVPVYMGTGAVTTRESVELTLAAADAGVDYAVVISPYYIKPNQAQLAEHYLTVCRESPIPVMAYNIPERTGVELTPEMIREVAGECPAWPASRIPAAISKRSAALLPSGLRPAAISSSSWAVTT